jgi:hypothetical protein
MNCKYARFTGIDDEKSVLIYLRITVGIFGEQVSCPYSIINGTFCRIARRQIAYTFSRSMLVKDCKIILD